MEFNLAQTIHNAFISCLFSDGENTSSAVIVDTILGKIGFHPERLESFRQVVIDVIQQMPMEFRPKKKGGSDGWSFLNLCMTKNGDHWAEHITMNEFMALAFALKLGKFLLPREFWCMLPGGMPYLILDDEELNKV